MKKIFGVLLIISVICFFAGCSAKTENAPSAAPSVAAKEENTREDPAEERHAEDNTDYMSSDEEQSEEKAAKTDDEPDSPRENGKASPSANGKLRVSGTSLIDENGSEVQLKGISTHGLSWFPQYINDECFKQLSEDFGANVVRLAMYTAESGGYTADGDKEKLKQLVKDGVNYAKEADMYAIIDWHTLSDNNPNDSVDEAVLFFDEMSEEFSDYNNVIYEICNEPNNGTTWNQIKEYAEKIIPVIRANDPDAVILTGTPNWCQYIDEAAQDPLDFENVMYTVHYYAATHKEDLRERVKAAKSAGLPIFISEYGICDASGNGAIDYEQAALWAQLEDELNLSSVMWNLSNKDETSAIINPNCDKTNGFTDEDLSEAGRWIKAFLNGEISAAAPEDADTDGGSGERAQNTSGSVEEKADSLNVKVGVANSWEENGKKVTQYLIEIENAGPDADEWSVDFEFDGDFAYKDGWNGNFSASGNTLTVTNAEYNGSVKKGEKLSDIGFIVAGDGKIVNVT